jgi:hypothetical protein
MLGVLLFIFIIGELTSEAFQVTDVSEIKATLSSILDLWGLEIKK